VRLGCAPRRYREADAVFEVRDEEMQFESFSADKAAEELVKSSGSVLQRNWHPHSVRDVLSAPTVSLLGAALAGGGGAFRSTNTYMPNVQAIAAVQPARMSEG
jgi:hypothetical protein